MTHPARSALDAALAENGETITLRRRIGTTSAYVDVDCLAVVRGYAPHELVSGITQQDSFVILSPSEIGAAGWPGAAGGVAWPQKGDFAVIGGKQRAVEAGTPFRIGTGIVRIEMQVRG